jgi:hypothetical protein
MSSDVEYVRRAYEHTMDWYKNADTKAQIIFTLDGAFLAFVTGSIFMNQGDLAEILQNFTPWGWVFLIIMAISLILSIFCAIACLWSRIPLLPKAKAAFLSDKQIESSKVKTYKPEASWFFQHISWLDKALLPEFFKSVDKDFEVAALSANLHKLSEHVADKHKWIDGSFVFLGTSLISFFLMWIIYVFSLD